jgi:outer membrane protein assembly factor BamB
MWIPSPPYEAPPVALGGAIVWAAGGTLRAADSRNGGSLWEGPAGKALALAPGGERLFVREPEAVRALDAGTGAELWRTPVPEPTGPISALGEVLAVPAAGRMLLLDARSGAFRAGAPAGRDRKAAARAGAAVLLDGVLFYGADDRSVTALELRGGVRRVPRRVWNLRRGGVVLAAPVPAGRGLLLLSQDNEVAFVLAEDGYRVWRRPLRLRPSGEIAVLGGSAYVAGVGAERIESFSLSEGGDEPPLLAGAPDRLFIGPVVADAVRGRLLAVTGPYGYTLLAFGPGAPEGTGDAAPSAPETRPAAQAAASP